MRIVILVVVGVILIAIIIFLIAKTAFLVNFQPISNINFLENIVYVPSSLDPKHRLDVYLPKNKTKFPVIHFVHGGYWSRGDKSYYQALTGTYRNLGISLAKQGIGVVIQNYRLQPKVSADEQIGDIVQAVKWTTENVQNYGGQDIYLMGHSAGGHLISLVGSDPQYYRTAGIDPDLIRGYIPISGIFDLVDMEKFHDQKFNEQVTYKFFGRTKESLQHYSPSFYFRTNMPRILFLLGENDFPFLIAQTPAVVNLVKSFGNTPEYIVIPGYNHIDMVTKIGSRTDKVTRIIKEFVSEP